ncbi:hypothetical protein ACHQM5_008827 [Ranunculus cassubicifolius]
MLSLRKFWTRNKRKVYVTVGVLGSGYVLYRLYATHKQKLDDLDKELAREREVDELIKSQFHKKMVLSLWATTTLNLYIGIQINILGRHLYIDTAGGMESSYILV